MRLDVMHGANRRGLCVVFSHPHFFRVDGCKAHKHSTSPHSRPHDEFLGQKWQGGAVGPQYLKRGGGGRSGNERASKGDPLRERPS